MKVTSKKTYTLSDLSEETIREVMQAIHFSKDKGLVFRHCDEFLNFFSEKEPEEFEDVVDFSERSIKIESEYGTLKLMFGKADQLMVDKNYADVGIRSDYANKLFYLNKCSAKELCEALTRYMKFDNSMLRKNIYVDNKGNRSNSSGLYVFPAISHSVDVVKNDTKINFTSEEIQAYCKFVQYHL